MATFVEEKFLSGGGGDGMGLGGGGALGLIALLALLGRGNNGLFGNGDGSGVSGLNNLQGAIDTNAMMTQLADITHKSIQPRQRCGKPIKVFLQSTETKSKPQEI